MAEKKTGEMSLSEVQAAIAEMLRQAREEADAIVAEAKAQKENKEEAQADSRAKAIAEDFARGEELVDIRLHRDNGKYKDDVFVGVNGDCVLIKRGERVKIKRKFAEVLENSEQQDYLASMWQEKQEKEYEKVAKAFA